MQREQTPSVTRNESARQLDARLGRVRHQFTIWEITSELKALSIGDAVLSVETISCGARDSRVEGADRRPDAERVAARLADVADRKGRGRAGREALPVPQIATLAGESTVGVASQGVRITARCTDVFVVIAPEPQRARVNARGLVEVFGQAVNRPDLTSVVVSIR